MKSLILLLSILLSASLGQANNQQYTDAELTDPALIAVVDDIAAELNANDHNQEIMNMAYNRARVVRMKLNRFLPKIDGLEDASDSDILPLLQDIVDQLLALDHKRKTLEKVKRHLDQTLYKLEENRNAPTEIAILTIDGDDPYNFGILFSSSFVYSVPFNITNSGNGAASIITEVGLDAPFGFREGGYPGDTGTCGLVIQANETCQIFLEFRPKSVGVHTDEFILEYFDGATPQNITKGVFGEAI